MESRCARANVPSNPFEFKEDRMFICETGMLCLEASLTNTILLLVDENYASDVLLKEPLLPMVSFTGATKWVSAYAKNLI